MIVYIIIILIALVSVVAWKYKLADFFSRKFVESRELISTDIDDAFPCVGGIEDYQPRPVSDETVDELARNGEVTVGPGVHDFYFQSFCLDAGKHSPSPNSVYLVAPLKGKRSSIVKSLLKNSTKRPDIPQHKIQSLVWAILSGAKYGEMSSDLRLTADQLLAEEELRSLRKGFWDKIPWPIRGLFLAEFKKRLPGGVLRALAAADKIKEKIADAQTTYEELMRIAIPSGRAPVPPGIRKVEAGTWSLAHGGGQFFMRTFLKSYSCSRVQVCVPGRKYWVELADRMAKKYGVDPRILKAVVEAETGGKNIKGDYSKEDGRYHAFGYGQVWPKWHYEKIWKSMRDAGLEIPQGNVKDSQYRQSLGGQLIQNDEVSMATAALVVREFWKQSGNINDFSDDHFRKFTKRYVGSGIPEKDLNRRLKIWHSWKNGLGMKEQINFNPGKYAAIPINPNEQRLGFRGTKSKGC